VAGTEAAPAGGGGGTGHKSNTGVVVGLSVAGGMVALVALVAAGVAVRRRMSGSGGGASGSNVAPIFSPAAILHRGKEFITGGRHAQAPAGGLMPAYRRLRAPTGGRSAADAGDASESELNPLSKGGEGPAADTAPIAGSAEASTGGDAAAPGSHGGKRSKGHGGGSGAKVQPTK
jgi:hypothetical protein